MKPCISLKDKSVIVVGAAGLIGQGIVQGALEAGANVLAFDSSKEGLGALDRIHKNQERLFCGVIDITDIQSIEFMFKKSVERFGPPNGAVNAAYPRNTHYGRKYFEVTYVDFCENLNLHLGGYFLFMQQCAKFSMEHNQKFSLVNMSSIYGVIAPRFDIYSETSMTMPVEYAAIKSGIIHLTRYTNSYTKGLFRANCVSPGGIIAGQDSKFLKRYDSYCMTKGMLEVKDIVGTILYLLSDTAEFVVGQNIVIDDGFSL